MAHSEAAEHTTSAGTLNDGETAVSPAADFVLLFSAILAAAGTLVVLL